MTTAPASTAVPAAGDGRTRSRIETRSIDYVPSHERSGRLTDQATIWFGGSAHILSLATGAIGITLGLNLIWTLIALIVGTVVGTVPVAAHATQGPHLGLPQMVQSRPQFGRYGALFIWAMAIVVYWGYVILGDNLLGATANQLGWGGAGVWTVLVGVAAIVLAIFGYHWLHIAQRWVTLALVVVLAVYVIGLIVEGRIPASTMSLGSTFSLAPFMVVVSAAAAYQLSWAFFVSDYSRYMPADTNKRAIMGYTATGLFFGVLAFEVVGAICAALLPKDSITAGLAATGDYIFSGFGDVVLVVGALGLLGLMAMCIYGGSLTLITALDSLRPVRPTRAIRVVTILIVGVSGAIAAVYLPATFLNTSFATVLAVLAYLMAPWTAVNLVDFFVVRRGQYSIREIFNARGIYGLWNWRGITAYLLGFLSMTPFMNLSFYEGPVAKAFNGVDIAFFIGIPVGAISYALLCRGMDLARERSVIATADLGLDQVAEPIA
ncbi:MAG TPA: cytosine permease [Jatrophihabitantaceae bacterium]|jgi:purine-cytosine permease-like protein|nr:cytosine permease [Jatrophihabitantaceae bacterium]